MNIYIYTNTCMHIDDIYKYMSPLFILQNPICMLYLRILFSPSPKPA